MCHRLGVTLPLGARAVYSLDTSTGLVKTIAVDVTFQGKPVHMEREWRDYRSVQGLRYPASMTYPGRDGKVHVARVTSVVFNPPIDAGRFQLPADAK